MVSPCPLLRRKKSLMKKKQNASLPISSGSSCSVGSRPEAAELAEEAGWGPGTWTPAAGAAGHPRLSTARSGVSRVCLCHACARARAWCACVCAEAGQGSRGSRKTRASVRGAVGDLSCVCSPGNVRISDLGLAVELKEGQTKTKGYAGTPGEGSLGAQPLWGWGQGLSWGPVAWGRGHGECWGGGKLLPHPQSRQGYSRGPAQLCGSGTGTHPWGQKRPSAAMDRAWGPC